MYHGPNLLDRSSVVNLGNVCLPRFTFGCFYCTPGFRTDDPVIFHIGGFLCFWTVLSAFLRFLIAALHSSLNQTVSCFTDLFLLLGMVASAIEMRVEVKCATGSSESKAYPCPSSESTFSEKVTQSALESFQLGLV